jgi:hypothetical protein
MLLWAGDALLLGETQPEVVEGSASGGLGSVLAAVLLVALYVFAIGLYVRWLKKDGRYEGSWPGNPVNIRQRSRTDARHF